MATHLYDCKECGTAVTLDPPISERLNHDGTRIFKNKKEAAEHFGGKLGGMCVDCFVAHRSQPSVNPDKVETTLSTSPAS